MDNNEKMADTSGSAKNRSSEHADQQTNGYPNPPSRRKKSEKEEKKKEEEKKLQGLFCGGLGAFRTGNLSKFFYQPQTKMSHSKPLFEWVKRRWRARFSIGQRLLQLLTSPKVFLPTATIQRNIIPSLLLIAVLLRRLKMEEISQQLSACPSVFRVEATREGQQIVSAASIELMVVSSPSSALKWEEGNDIVVAAPPVMRQVIQVLSPECGQPRPEDRQGENGKISLALVPLITAVIQRDHRRLRQLLRDPHLDVNARDAQGKTALHHAVLNHDLEAVENLLAHLNTDPNVVDDEGNTPLESAFKQDCFRNWNIVERLLRDNRVNVCVTNHHGQSTTSINAANHQSQSTLTIIVAPLLDALGAATQGPQGEQYSLLIVLYLENQFIILQQLLAFPEIDVNATDDAGQTLLMWAASLGDEALVEQLLRRPEIAVNIQDNDGLSALAWAVAYLQSSAAKLLLQYPDISRSVTAVDGAGRSLLRIAQDGYLDSLSELLKAESGLQEIEELHKDYMATVATITRLGTRSTATNVESFKQAMMALDTEGVADIAQAFSGIVDPFVINSWLNPQAIS